jgi:hypothetical protein
VRLGELGLETNCLPILGDRLVDPSALFQDSAEVIAGGCQARLEADRLAIFGHRFIEPARECQRLGEIEMRGDIAGLEPDRFPQRGKPFIPVGFDAAEEGSQVAMRLDEVGIEPDRRAVLGDRLVEMALDPQVQGEAVVGSRVVLPEPEEFPERRAAPGVIVLLIREDQAEGGVGLGEVGLEPDRLPEFGDRFVRPTDT